jgi:hypothetical protein
MAIEQPTLAQRSADRAREVLERDGSAGFAAMLHPDFVQELRHGVELTFTAEQLLGTVDSMKHLDFHIDGDDVAIAGDRCLLTRRRYLRPTGPGTETEMLAISVWHEDGRLTRLIEFDADALDDAIVELESVAEDAVVRLDD